MLQRTLPAGFIAPCLPTKAHTPPSGRLWLHEIKHDGERVKLFSRRGDDLTSHFPLIVESLARLRPRSCIIDGGQVRCDDNGLPSFDRLRQCRHTAACSCMRSTSSRLTARTCGVTHWKCKTTLASILAKAGLGLRFNEHVEHDDGETVFSHACKLGLEGIVSKRKDSPYRSGRSQDWLKMKSTDSQATKEEAEEDWGRR